jgi:hydrogenase nickel incorporation protein HypA/HybF
VHEFGLAVNMIELAEEAARAAGASQIEVIRLEVGALAGVVPEALEFAFQGAREGTLAADATLDVTYLPALCHCAACDADFELDNRFGIADCPTCGTPSADLRQGRELNLRDVAVR